MGTNFSVFENLFSQNLKVEAILITSDPGPEDTEVKHYYFLSSLSHVIHSKLDRLKRKENITGRGINGGSISYLLPTPALYVQSPWSKWKFRSTTIKKYPPCFNT